MTTKADYVRTEAKKGNHSGHVCHAKGCGVHVAPAMLMCRKHWAMVPLAEQRAIWRTYRPGQEKDKAPSREYVLAMRAARDAVAAVEGRPRKRDDDAQRDPDPFDAEEWKLSHP